MVSTRSVAAAAAAPSRDFASDWPRRSAASFESIRRSCRNRSYGCSAAGATTFTPSRLRLASSRLRFPGASTSSIVRVFAVQARQRLAKFLGLVRAQRPALHHRQFLLRQLGRKRRTQRAQHHLLAAAHRRNCAAAARARCRPCARSRNESIPRARGRCPSAAKACGPSRKLRRGPWSCAFRRAARPDTSARFHAAGAD